MVGKGLRFLVLTALAVHVARQWPDVVRFSAYLTSGRRDLPGWALTGSPPHPQGSQEKGAKEDGKCR
jgi:hypothetical protein